MELKLHIYEGRSVVKTYTADSIDFKFGVVEDILDALDFENMKEGSKQEIAKMVVKCARQLRPFLMDLFDGVTAEEIRNTRMQNLVEVFTGIFNYASEELGILNKEIDAKN